jgi:hypothetical protein
MFLGATNSAAGPIPASPSAPKDPNNGVVVIGRPGACLVCASTPGDIDCETKEEKVFRRCSRCKNADYCSERCQRNHWQKEHKLSCVQTHVPFPERKADKAHLFFPRDFAPPFVSPAVIRDFRSEQEQIRLLLKDKTSPPAPVWRFVCVCLCERVSECVCVCSSRHAMTIALTLENFCQ